MNAISDINLAIAVSKAGAVPSLFLDNYVQGDYENKTDWKQQINSDLSLFSRETNSSDVILSFSYYELSKLYKEIIELTVRHNITHYELLGLDIKDHNQKLVISSMRKRGVKMLYKSNFYPKDPDKETLSYIDALMLKTKEGAGRIVESAPDIGILIDHCKIHNSHLKIIVCGGISTKEDIEYYLDKGAHYVGIGTLFALSKESIISEKTKRAVIESKQISKIKSGSMKQNAVIVGNYDGGNDSRDRNVSEAFKTNNTGGLRSAVRGNDGHLFIGKGIENVNEILSVDDIVKKLTQ